MIQPTPDICCDTCPHKRWVTEKEWNYTIQDHLPITLECLITGKHWVRNATHVCEKHPLYASRTPKSNLRKRR